MRRATPSAGGPYPAWDVSWPHPAPAPSCSRRGRRWRSRSPARQLPAFPARPPGQDFAIEFVHALDDGLHQLAGGGIVGVLGDGDHPDTPPAEHGLEGDGVFPLAGEAGELPDQDFLKGGSLGPCRQSGSAVSLRLSLSAPSPGCSPGAGTPASASPRWRRSRPGMPLPACGRLETVAIQARGPLVQVGAGEVHQGRLSPQHDVLPLAVRRPPGSSPPGSGRAGASSRARICG